MRKVCVVTGGRSDYGLLYWLLKEIENDPELELKLAVTGTHLNERYDSTYKIIENDGFKISAKVDLNLSSDSPQAISHSIGNGVIGFAKELGNIQPDILVVLGDRYEILAACVAALPMGIPIAHIHGGELTEGLIDEAIRHSITKMAHFHFVSAEPYRKRVIQLGENPKFVYNVGAPGLDHLTRQNLLTKEELEHCLDIHLSNPIFLITYHPVTLDRKASEEGIKQLLLALDAFPTATKIFTKPNADPDNNVINKLIINYANQHKDRSSFVVNLGQLKYLSLMKISDVIIGNSSSGIIEAPALKKAVVNIGDRQRGRLQATCIINSREDRTSIESSIQNAMSDSFQTKLSSTSSIYGQGGTIAATIKNYLKNLPLDEILKKKFYDLAATS